MNTLHKILYNTGERLRGWNVLERLEQLHQMERYSPAQIDAFQLDKLKRLVYHSYQNVPFYRKFWDQAGAHPDQIQSLNDLSKFPKVTKLLLVEAGELTLDQRYPKSKFIQGRSSGSTGERFVFYKDKAHHSWFVAGALHGWTWTGWDLGDPWVRLQFRGDISLRAKIDDWIFNCLYMPIDKLDDDFLREFVDKAVRFKPTILRGYAGGTYVFAKFLLQNPAKQIRPKAVICTGDTLYPHYRQAIEEAFQCPVFDTYGGEGISVANQCEKGSYHILPSVYVELEPSGAPMANEQPGRVLLTSLTNYAMPMIRYDIADIGILGRGLCACGRTWNFLKKIVGRETDIVVTPSGRHLVCHHFNNVLREIDGINQYQILQEKLKQITLRLVTNPKYNQTLDEPSIIKNISELGGEGFSVKIEYVDSMPLPPSGKRRYIISKVSGSTVNS